MKEQFRIIIDIEIDENFFRGCYQEWREQCEDISDDLDFKDYCYEQLRDSTAMAFAPVGGDWSINDEIRKAFDRTGGIDYDK